MSKWVDRFERHELHKSLDSIYEIVEDVQGTANSIDADSMLESERIISSLNHVKRRLKTLDPSLIPMSVLNSMNQHAQQIFNELNNFRSNKNPTHLENANNQVDNLLIQTSNFPSVVSSVDVESVKDAIASFRRSVGQFLRHLEDENATVQDQLTDISIQFKQLKADIDNQKSRLDTAITEFQRQFSEAEDRRRESSTNAENSDNLNLIRQSKKEGKNMKNS